MFLNRPRIKFNGVYVCEASYLRYGESQTSMTRPIIKTIYYKYLRFFPDGSMIMVYSKNLPKKYLEKVHRQNPDC